MAATALNAHIATLLGASEVASKIQIIGCYGGGCYKFTKSLSLLGNNEWFNKISQTITFLKFEEFYLSFVSKKVISLQNRS